MMLVLSAFMQHSGELTPYLNAVAPYLNQYGYYAIFLGVFLEDFGIPLPGETLLISGALLASGGTFKIYWVVPLGILAAIFGDNVGYAIGYFGGRRLVKRYGKYIFLPERRLRKLEKFFDKHGARVVLVARFIEGFRQFNGIAAGTSRMSWRTFFIYNSLGAILWAGFWTGIAFFLGTRLESIFKFFKHFELYILVGAGALVIIYIVYRFLGRNWPRHG